MGEFKFSDAAVALEMRKVERRGGSSDDMRHAALEEIARQLHAAGAPVAPLEQQFATLLASHLAMREAWEEMPSAEQICIEIQHVPHLYDRAGHAPIHAAAETIDGLFRPLLAKRTRERDEEREDAAGARATVRDFEKRVYMLELERDTLRQRAERAEDELRAAKLEAHDGAVKVQNETNALRARIAELESRLKRAECPICHGSGVLRGTNEYELDTTCPKVVDHG